MNEKLIDELYETADRYQGRMSELLKLAASAIQRLESNESFKKDQSFQKSCLNKISEYHANTDETDSPYGGHCETQDEYFGR